MAIYNYNNRQLGYYLNKIATNNLSDLSDNLKATMPYLFNLYPDLEDQQQNILLNIMNWIKTYCWMISDRELLGIDTNELIDEAYFTNQVLRIILTRFEALITTYFNLKSYQNENEGIIHQLISNTPFEWTGKTSDKDFRNRIRQDNLTIDWHEIKQSQSVYIRDVVFFLDNLKDSLELMTNKFLVC